MRKEMNIENLKISQIQTCGELVPTKLKGKKVYKLKFAGQFVCFQIISFVENLAELNDIGYQITIEKLQQNYQNCYSKATMTQSPYIINIFRYIENPKYAHLQQENFHCTLSQYVQEQNLGYTRKMQLIENIIKGVEALHEVKIMHRNLHPDNIVICLGGKKQICKICGFMDGFDFSQQSPRAADGLINITEFSAPEIRNYQDHNEKVDIWSIGALLSWLLFGKKMLIELENHSENQSEHKTVIHCPEKTPTWLMRILNNMLAYNPNDRFSMKDITMTISKAIACSETIASIMDQLS